MVYLFSSKLFYIIIFVIKKVAKNVLNRKTFAIRIFVTTAFILQFLQIEK